MAGMSRSDEHHADQTTAGCVGDASTDEDDHEGPDGQQEHQRHRCLEGLREPLGLEQQMRSDRGAHPEAQCHEDDDEDDQPDHLSDGVPDGRRVRRQHADDEHHEGADGGRAQAARDGAEERPDHGLDVASSFLGRWRRWGRWRWWRRRRVGDHERDLRAVRPVIVGDGQRDDIDAERVRPTGHPFRHVDADRDMIRPVDLEEPFARRRRHEPLDGWRGLARRDHADADAGRFGSLVGDGEGGCPGARRIEWYDGAGGSRSRKRSPHPPRTHHSQTLETMATVTKAATA